ncbi:MAG: AAA family ATPase, partial [Spirochaetales bacterium]|nr:AAA family ATPase [Spirochaetales bacterium]
RAMNLHSIIVADAGLGTINAVVLTAEYMASHNLPVRGIIFNRYHKGNIMEEDNLYMCEKMTGLPVLACVQNGDTDIEIDDDILKGLYK